MPGTCHSHLPASLVHTLLSGASPASTSANHTTGTDAPQGTSLATARPGEASEDEGFASSGGTRQLQPHGAAPISCRA